MTNGITINNNKRLGLNSGIKGVITPKNEKSVTLYFNEINNFKFDSGLTKEEEVKIFRKIKQGDEAARTRLIYANLRFVISVAKLYINQGLPFEDLINEGNIGLIRCVNKFKPEKNIKFLSYAVWWIRQAILQALVDTGKTVRIPMNKKESLIKVNKKIALLEKELERKPTMEEIVENTDGLDYDNVLDILSSNHSEISLDAPFSLNKNGEEDGSLYDLLVADELSETTTSEELNSEMFDLLKELPYKERRILQMFTGVLVQKKYTLDEIGKEFNLTRERVRQIKENAIRRLRNNPKIQNLLEYV